VSFRFRSSKRGSAKCYELRNRDTSYPASNVAQPLAMSAPEMKCRLNCCGLCSCRHAKHAILRPAGLELWLHCECRAPQRDARFGINELNGGHNPLIAGLAATKIPPETKSGGIMCHVWGCPPGEEVWLFQRGVDRREVGTQRSAESVDRRDNGK
jgi:hypothetical protein